MKAELILTAETSEDEEMLSDWRDGSLQAYIKDVLEIDAEEHGGREIHVQPPAIAYIGKNGRVIYWENQEPKPFDLSMRRLTQALHGIKESLKEA